MNKPPFKSKPQGLVQWATQSSVLSDLIARAQAIDKLNELIQAALEPDLAAQTRVANLRKGTLILSTSSPVWKHKLRFKLNDLLSSLRKSPRWAGLIRIEIKIDPSTEEVPLIEDRSLLDPQTLSEASAASIQALADCTEHQGLKAALEKLAARSPKP